MKRLLVISYGYAPTNMIGTMRVIKFVKYLSRWGWQCIVVTPKYLPALPQDPDLLKEVPADTIVIGTRSFEPQDLVARAVGTGVRLSGRTSPRLATNRKSIQRMAAFYRGFINFLMIPDDMIVWKWLAQPAVDQAIRQYRPHVIMSSAPPYTAHLLALHAAKKFHLPWIADFRDEWTINPFRSFPTPGHKQINKFLEQQVLMAADAITCVSEPMTVAMARLAPRRPAGAFQTIFNGFDQEDFDHLVTTKTNQFTITYTGNFYGHRSPNSFLRAALTFVKQRQLQPSQFRLLFVGGNAFPIDSDIDLEIISRFMDFRATVPHRQSIELMRTSSILLLVISTASGVGSLTGKIFEYLASQRPILALIPNGRASDIIRESGSGLVVNPDDIQGIVQGLGRLYDAWAGNRLAQDFPCRIPWKFSRKQQSRGLYTILEALSSKVQH